jgi:putative toxin-antitoxin system antitoxin component (TIGR02293 family)
MPPGLWSGRFFYVYALLAKWRYNKDKMASAIAELLGGEKVLGKRIREPFGLVEKIREGLPYRSLERVRQALDLSREETSRTLSIPLRTLDRRKQSGKLTREESDRLYRVARVTARATEVFEDAGKAAHWLRRSNRALGYRVPIDLLDNNAGEDQVETILIRIEHGVYS